MPSKIEVVERLYNEGWGPGDMDVALAQLHPGVVWTAIESAPDSGTRRGHEECRAYMEDWLESFDFPTGQEIEVLHEAGDVLVTRQRGIGTGRGSGVTTEIEYACTYTFDGDLIAEIHEFATREEALRAAGLDVG